MKRKIIKQGIGGHTIFLPISWIREHGLAPGNEVEIIKEGTNLTIHSKEKIQKKDITISLPSVEKYHIRSVLASCYKTGYTSITLQFKEKINFTFIHEIVSSFTGLEVVSQKETSVEINCFLQMNNEDCTPLINKMFHTTQYIITYTLSDPKKINIDEINILTSLSARRLRDHTLQSIYILKYGGEKSYEYYDIVTILEKICASYKRLAKYIIQKDTSKIKELQELETIFSQLHRSYLDSHFKSANKVFQNALKLRDMSTNLLIANKTKQKDQGLTGHIYHISQLYVHLASRLVSLRCRS